MIAAVGLNLSIDRRYVLECPRLGAVNRVQQCTWTPGGKSLNVARVIKALGAEVVAGGIVGGFSGQLLESMLDQAGIAHALNRVSGETRSCINVIDAISGEQTEFLEPGEAVSEQEMAAFYQTYENLVKGCALVTLSGSLPRGLPPDTYGTLIRLAKAAGAKVLLDTSGPALKAALEAGPTLIKPNEDEIRHLAAVNDLSVESLALAARGLRDAGTTNVVVSLSRRGAILAGAEGAYHACPPGIKPVNTVGCGDAMIAAFAVSLAEGLPAREALRHAVAVSAASALSPGTGSVEAAAYHDMLPKVKLINLD